ncbi:MAG: hypothetical protein IT364_24665 [Candidatus Hydrogenedentes bacterium]|nr:hypothetical protein [Candidatus Hydrogenedentota bacterium]
MHYGNLDRDTAAGRIYRDLSARRGQWCDAWVLMTETRTTAVSTRVSEVRAQLEASGRDERIEVDQRGKKWFYRIVAEPKQMELIA